MIIQLPDHVKIIIQTLEKAGYEAFAVGGCVRDSILGRTPDDWDITTSANPFDVKKLFRRTFDTGIQHGTITVLFDKTGYEVTTYRIDGIYEDGRHPKDVTFTSNLQEDLKRRDFTINAMAYNDSAGLIDCYNGMNDIALKIIRCVGNPQERFSEDALRIMRAVRFSAQLGYDIESRTADVIKRQAADLQRISAERIQVELVKLLISSHPEKFIDLYEMNITKVIMPEFDAMMETKQNHPHHIYNVGEHTIHALMTTRQDKILRLAVLFHDIGKPLVKTTDDDGVDHFYGHAKASERIADQILRRLKFDNDTIYKVTKLVYNHDRNIEPTPRAVRHALADMGEELFALLLEVKWADAMGQSEYRRKDKQLRINELRSIYQNTIEQKECFDLKNLAVTGSDLITIGMRPGKEIGQMLHELLELVLEDPNSNEKSYLLEVTEKKLSSLN